MQKNSRSLFFVNLKRFDVPRSRGGICPEQNPSDWIRSIIDKITELGLGRLQDVDLVLLVPESLLIPSVEALADLKREEVEHISIGSQTVYRDDCTPGGNFGAFTSNLPASAARASGAAWSMIGHSEERRDKLGIIASYDPSVVSEHGASARAGRCVDEMIGNAVARALDSPLHVLLCVGETSDQRGTGSFEQQQPRIVDTLRSQLSLGLSSIPGDRAAERKVVIGYEPIWAIGPGKTPPDPGYVSFVAQSIKAITQEIVGSPLPVVYGGGLKSENARAFGEIQELDGGLVALTTFSPPLAFEPEGLNTIMDQFLGGRKRNS